MRYTHTTQSRKVHNSMRRQRILATDTGPKYIESVSFDTMSEVLQIGVVDVQISESANRVLRSISSVHQIQCSVEERGPPKRDR